MYYRKIPYTDLEVSRIGLGTMTFGEQNSLQDACAQLDYARERGINFVDTAELYPVPPRAATQGRTEAYIGEWLKKRACRQQLILASKVAGPGGPGAHIRNGSRLNKAHIEQALHDSLKRLYTDYIDLYQLHWPERSTNFFGQLGYRMPEQQPQRVEILETLEALTDQVRAGKIRYIGLSNETAWGLSRYLTLSEQQNLSRVITVQNPYNLLNRSYEQALAEFACEEGVGLLAYSPLAFGVLSGKYLYGRRPKGARLTLFERFSRYTREQGVAATREYVNLAYEYGLDPARMALAFVTQQPFVFSNLVGATTLEQLKANIDSIDLELGDDLLARINEIHHRYTYPCP